MNVSTVVFSVIHCSLPLKNLYSQLTILLKRKMVDVAVVTFILVTSKFREYCIILAPLLKLFAIPSQYYVHSTRA